MKPSIFAVLAVTLTVSGWADAATMVTPGLEKENTSAFRCFVINAGNKPFRDTTLEIRNDNGVVVSSANVTGLAPGRMHILADVTDHFFGYCVLDGKFQKSKARLSFCNLLETGSATLECAGAVSGY